MSVDHEKSRFLLRLDSQIYKKLLSLSKTQKQSVNTLCSLFISNGLQSEIQDQKWIQEVVSCYENESLLAIILFGSQSRGDATSNSDIDILFVFDSDTKITRSLYRKFENKSEAGFNQGSYSVHCVSLPDDIEKVSGFWFEIALDGKVLWKKNNEINNWLNKVKTIICSGTYVRKISSGQPYWMQNEK